jgi:hypothetical protein
VVAAKGRGGGGESPAVHDEETIELSERESNGSKEGALGKFATSGAIGRDVQDGRFV